MTDVLAIVPARAGSKGIPNKNFRLLAGISPYERAFHCAVNAGLPIIVTTTDWVIDKPVWRCPIVRPVVSHWIQRDPRLAQDDTPMVEVVQDALDHVPGPPDQIIVLLQPTQPLRTPGHILSAIKLLEQTKADSVVSVVETRSPDELLELRDGNRLKRSMGWSLGDCPSRRQDMTRGFWRDGTCYLFRRETVTRHGDIYGVDCRALVIPPTDTCALDTMADWAEAERRLRERAVHAHV